MKGLILLLLLCAPCGAHNRPTPCVDYKLDNVWCVTSTGKLAHDIQPDDKQAIVLFAMRGKKIGEPLSEGEEYFPTFDPKKLVYWIEWCIVINPGWMASRGDVVNVYWSDTWRMESVEATWK